MNEHKLKTIAREFLSWTFLFKTQKFILKRQNPSQIGVHFVIFLAPMTNYVKCLWNIYTYTNSRNLIK